MVGGLVVGGWVVSGFFGRWMMSERSGLFLKKEGGWVIYWFVAEEVKSGFVGGREVGENQDDFVVFV